MSEVIVDGQGGAAAELQLGGRSSAPKAGAQDSSAAAPRAAAVDNKSEDRQAAIVALGRRAIASSDVSLLLQDAAALLAESLDADASGVAEILPDGTSFVLRVASVENHTEPAVMQECGLDQTQSLAGFTLSVAYPVVVADLAAEQRFGDGFLRRQGMRSAICCPLQLLDDSFGALAVYSQTVGKFAELDIVFVEAVAHLVTTTIGRERVAKALEQERRFAKSVLDTVDSLVITLTLDGKVIRANSTCDRVLGFTPEEMKDRPLWSAFLAAEDVPPMLAAFDQLRRGQVPTGLSTDILTKQGQWRRVSWTFGLLKDQRGNVQSVVATALDVSDKVSAEAKLKEALKQSQPRDQAAGSSPAPKPFQSLEEGPGSERRSKPRRAYPYKQLVGSVRNGQLPQRSAFKEVQCRDISAGGFSYFSDSIPPEKSLVVAFGSGDALIYLLAEALHSRPIEQDGQKVYIVGCRYTGRATY